MKHRTLVRDLFRFVVMVLALGWGLAASAAGAETVTYYYTSPQGTVLATADAAGNLLTTTDYRPYGAQALGSPAPGPGYTGHVGDPDSGLVYMQARYYEPAVGRFLSTDPAGAGPGDILAFNSFAYAHNNPVGNVDPDGRQTVPGSINWQAPGMMEAWKTTGRNVTLPVLLDTVVPGGGLINCASQGCSGGEWAMAALPMVGEVRGAGRVVIAGERMAQAAAKGARGEAAVKETYNIGERLRFEINGSRRISDGFRQDVSISEIKNVSRQGLTSQIKDYMQFAQKSDLRFDLYTNESTKLSAPLQQAVDAGAINHIRVPMQ